MAEDRLPALTGNPADDEYAISAGTGQKVSVSPVQPVGVGSGVTGATPSSLMVTDTNGDIASGPVTSAVVTATGATSGHVPEANGSGGYTWVTPPSGGSFTPTGDLGGTSGSTVVETVLGGKLPVASDGTNLPASVEKTTWATPLVVDGQLLRAGTSGPIYRATGYNITVVPNIYGTSQTLTAAQMDTYFAQLRPNSLSRLRAYAPPSGSGITWSQQLSTLDTVVAAAQKYGQRLIFCLTDWGSVDNSADAFSPKTTSWVTGQSYLHSVSGANSYQDWVQTLVARYAGNYTVAIYDLCNEPLDSGSNTTAFETWFNTARGWIRTIDSNLLVYVGIDTTGDIGGLTAYETVNTNMDILSSHSYTNLGWLPTDIGAPAASTALTKPLLIDESGVWAKEFYDSTDTDPSGNPAVTHEAQGLLWKEQTLRMLSQPKVAGVLYYSYMDSNGGGWTDGHGHYEPINESLARKAVRSVDLNGDPFSIDTLSGLSSGSWVDAVQTLLTAPGSALTSITDRATYSTASQTAGALAGTWNGNPTFQFTGAQRIDRGGWKTGGAQSSYFFAFAPTVIPNPGSWAYLMAPQATGTNGATSLRINSSGQVELTISATTGSPGPTSDTIVGTSSNAVNANDVNTLCVVWNAAGSTSNGYTAGTWVIILNGIIVTGTKTQTFTTQNGRLGIAYDGETDGFQGHILQAFMEPIAETPTNRSMALAYLTGKYAPGSANTGSVSSSMVLASAQPTTAVKLSVLPSTTVGQMDSLNNAGGGNGTPNGTPFIQDNVATDANGIYQYAIWWDTNSHPKIAQRKLPNGAWGAAVDLSSTALGTMSSIDGHLTLNIGVDSNGYIHISGNMHGATLLYIRSTVANSVTSGFTAPTMTGSNETLVCYPMFFRLPNGTLFFTYQVQSTYGTQYLNTYNVGSQTWTQVALVSGTGANEFPMANHVAVSKAGVIGLSWTWRASLASNVSNLTDMSYMQSSDGGSTWHTAAGSTVTLPVTHTSTPSIVAVAIADGSGMINTCGSDIDSNGLPHIASLRYDGSGNSQIKHTWFDGTSWHDDFATYDLTYAIGTAVTYYDQTIARPMVFCARSGPCAGRTYIVFRTPYNGRRGSIRCLDVTPVNNATPSPCPEFSLCDLDLEAWEPSFDTSALNLRNELHMLITPCGSSIGGIYAAEYFAVDNWNPQWGGVLSLDLHQFQAVSAGIAKLPRIHTVDSMSISAALTFTATTGADAAGMPEIMLSPKGRFGRIMVASWQARVNLVAGSTSGTWQLEENDGTNLRHFGTISPTTSSLTYDLPWMPLLDLNNQVLNAGGSGGGWLDVYGFSNNAAGTRFTLCTLHVGIIEGTL